MNFLSTSCLVRAVVNVVHRMPFLTQFRTRTISNKFGKGRFGGGLVYFSMSHSPYFKQMGLWTVDAIQGPLKLFLLKFIILCTTDVGSCIIDADFPSTKQRITDYVMLSKL